MEECTYLAKGTNKCDVDPMMSTRDNCVKPNLTGNTFRTYGIVIVLGLSVIVLGLRDLLLKVSS